MDFSKVFFSNTTLKPWYNEPRFSEFPDIVKNNPAPILRIYNAYYIWYSELFDIVNKNGPMDLFVISRFECVYIDLSQFFVPIL